MRGRRPQRFSSDSYSDLSDFSIPSGDDGAQRKGREAQPHELQLSLREPTAADLVLCAGAPPTAVPEGATVEPLGDAETAEVLQKMEAGGAQPVQAEGDAQDFAMRAKTMPAPRPGKIVEQPFPVPGTDEASLLAEAARLEQVASAGGPLKVMRAGPEGEVKAVPQVSITFNQPMVPLSEIDIQDGAAIAAKLGITMTRGWYNGRVSAADEGRWRWAGTQTLLFEPSYRMPAASEYEVKVPKGTKGAIQGVPMEEEYTFQFRTPPPRLLRSHPSGLGNRARPTLFAQFDQDLTTKENTLQYIKLKYKSHCSTEIRLELVEDRADVLRGLDADNPRHAIEYHALAGLFDSSISKRHLFFRPERDLPLDAKFSVEILQGLPSGEGTRGTETPQTWDFGTYPPLTLNHHSPDRPTPPCSSWSLRFSNDLDLELFNVDCVGVEPRPLDLRVEPNGSMILIRGTTKGKQTYRVRIAQGALTDIFGQTLAKDVNVTFAVTPAEQSLCSLHREVEIFDIIPFLSLGHTVPPVISAPLESEPTPPPEKAPRFSMQGMSEYLTDGMQRLSQTVGMSQTSEPLDSNLSLVPKELSNAQKAAVPHLSFVSVNLTKIRVTVYMVDPQRDYSKYIEWRREYRVMESNFLDLPFGKKLKDAAVEIQADMDEAVQTDVDLRPYLSEGSSLGHVFVIVQPVRDDWTNKRSWEYRPLHTVWMQVTHLAADVFSVNVEDMHLLCTRLEDGSPVRDAKVLLINDPVRRGRGKASVPPADPMTTNESGLCHISGSGELVHAVVSKENDSVLLSSIYEHRLPVQDKKLLVFTFDDRKLYRPGEHVTVSGTIRILSPVRSGRAVDVQMPSGAYKTKWFVTDSRRAEICKGELEVGPKGRFRVEFDLPDNVNCGDATIYFSFVGELTNHLHSFKIEEFRRPECKVSAMVKTTQPVVVGGVGVVAVNAKYYAGNVGLSGATASWAVSQQIGYFTPPSWTGKGYSWSSNDKGGWGFTTQFTCTGSWAHKASTDGSGEHVLAVQCDRGLESKGPMTVTLEATVTDLNRQARTSSCCFLVHPALLYVGLKLSHKFLRMDRQLAVEVVAVDLDGEAVDKDVILRLRRKYVERKGWSYVEKTDLLRTESVSTRQGSPGELLVKPEYGGWHWLEAEVVDGNGISNFSTASFFVAGGGADGPPGRQGKKIEADELRLLLPDRPFKPNEIAEVTIQAPFGPGSGVLCAVAKGLVAQLPFSVDAGGSAVVSLPLERWHIPQLALSALVCGSCPRDAVSADGVEGKAGSEAPLRPAFAFGEGNIQLPPECKRLDVKVQPSSAVVAPGSEVQVSVEVRSENGPEEGVEVTFVAVDESVLSLTDYNIPNPLNAFFDLGNFSCEYLNHYHSRQEIFAKAWEQVRFEEKEEEEEIYDEEDCLQMEAMKYSTRSRGIKMKGASRAMKSAPRAMAAAVMMDREEECLETFACKSALEMADEASAGGDDSAEGDDAGETAQVKTRSNFNALAAFQELVTDSTGHATVTFTLPDNLTAYRLWAVCFKGAELYGLGEACLEAALPLMLRPSLPRFLNFGDEAQLSVVVQNCASSTIEVKLACRANDPVLVLRRDLEDALRIGLKLTMPAGARHELRFQAAARSAGTARFQLCGLVARTPHSDAASVEFPVWTPATTEAFATYGHLDGSNLPDPRTAVAQPLRPPRDCFPQFGGLQVSVSSSILHTVSDAFLYLYSYPFECCEQVASKCLAVLALYDCLHAFTQDGSANEKLPSPQKMKSWLGDELQRIEKWQLPSGGFGWWMMIIPETSPWLTVHATHVLVRAKKKGVAVQQKMLDSALECCKNIERYCSGWSSETCKVAVLAKSLMVRALSLDLTAEKSSGTQLLQSEVANLLKRMGGSDGTHACLETVAFLLIAAKLCGADDVVQPLLQRINNCAHETAETATFPTSYGDDHEAKLLMIHSNQRTDAIVLMALICASPSSTLLVKAMKGLFAHQKKGRWNNTQENVWALLAIDAYFQEFEKTAPDFEARVLLLREVSDANFADWKIPSAVLALQHAFQGHNADRAEAQVPMSFLKENKEDAGEALVIVARQKIGGDETDPGTGRMYYRLGLQYAPADLNLEPLNVGFEVLRYYSALENPSDVRLEAGAWHVKAGCLVKITLHMTSVARRYHVALVDKLPGGFEPVNPELKGMASKASKGASTGDDRLRLWWCRPWFEHQNLRDERVEAFASLVWPGHHEYSYTARATCLGKFVAPPATAEEMYSPEIFGRSGTSQVVIA